MATVIIDEMDAAHAAVPAADTATLRINGSIGEVEVDNGPLNPVAGVEAFRAKRAPNFTGS